MHYIARLLLLIFLPLWTLAADLPAAPARKPAKTKNASMLAPETHAATGKRVALILANAGYQTLTRLDNPKRDAALIEKTLKSIGFTVVGGSRNGLELTAGDMHERLAEFARESADAEVALVYFAGHGIEDRSGEQFLVGIEHRATSPERLKSEAVSLGQIMQTLTESRAANNLVFLDACREKSRGTGTRAIKPTVDAPNTVIFYATAAGDLASDGAGFNSPFTKAVAAEMAKAGQEWRDFEIGVRKTVLAETGGKQEPKMYGGLNKHFYFVIVNQRQQDDSTEVAYWNSIKDSGDAGEFEAYLQQFPKGIFRGLAESRLKKLRAAQVVVPMVPMASVVRPEPTPVTKPPASTTPSSVSHQRPSLPLVQNIHGWSAERVQERQRQTAAALGKEVVFKDCNDCPEMVVIPAGTFMMGSPQSEKQRDGNERQHEVTISKPFAVGRYEVLFEEWDAFLASRNLLDKLKAQVGGDNDQGWGRGRHPAIDVSWHDAQRYVEWLSAKTGQAYRLLTEAEWEYAARSGATTAFHTGECINTAQANYDGNYEYEGCKNGQSAKTGEYQGKTLAVGSLAQNAWGLYDMHGNVWEWTCSAYDKEYGGGETRCMDGTGATGRAVRGGSWGSNPRNLRAANRGSSSPGDRNYILGFRLARTVSP